MWLRRGSKRKIKKLLKNIYKKIKLYLNIKLHIDKKYKKYIFNKYFEYFIFRPKCANFITNI